MPFGAKQSEGQNKNKAAFALSKDKKRKLAGILKSKTYLAFLLQRLAVPHPPGSIVKLVKT
jgi:hypothetical protein